MSTLHNDYHSEYGERGAQKIIYGDSEKAAPVVTGTALRNTGSVLADSRQ